MKINMKILRTDRGDGSIDIIEFTDIPHKETRQEVKKNKYADTSFYRYEILNNK